MNGAWRIQKERPWCPDKWPLRRAQPFDRDPFRALPADVVGRVLEATSSSAPTSAPWATRR